MREGSSKSPPSGQKTNLALLKNTSKRETFILDLGAYTYLSKNLNMEFWVIKTITYH